MKYTEIIFVIDASGSMAHLTNDTIGGFNGFVESQKQLDGKATLTTVLFDSYWRVLHDGVDINEVKPMTTSDYRVGGMTAMLDAIGQTIQKVQDRHDELGEEKPEKVLFVITTDGEENSSRQYKKSDIEKMIKHQTNGHGWTFMFLGANMDAVKEAESIGISKDYSTGYTYTSQGVNAVYNTMSCVTSAIRGVKGDSGIDGLGATKDCSFNLSDVYGAIATKDVSIDTLSSKTTISD